MAINTATSSIIVSKIEEISKKYRVNLDPSIKEVKSSTILQIWLVVFAVMTLILYKSKVIIAHFPDTYESCLNITLLTIFISAIDILRDTGLAIFIINEKTSKKENA
ncbi:hypothetical protein [Fibrella aestuarina]|uniref:hypothetical protein n=1 Tax=Fibrella aestuarina TaxID=651143 RepID=UPI0011D2C3D6|nr:hypothetical protein [Fibrella aestuarina]